MTRITARAAIVLCTSWCVALAACSGSSSKSEPTTSISSTAAPTTSTAPTAGPQAQVVAGVRAFWDMYLELGARTVGFNASDTRSRLSAHSSGKELSKLYETFQGNATAGYAIKGTIDIAPTVMSMNATTAVVQDCYDDNTGLYRISDGTRLDKNDPRRHKVSMTLVLEDGVWKVSTITDEGLGCTV